MSTLRHASGLRVLRALGCALVVIVALTACGRTSGTVHTSTGAAGSGRGAVPFRAEKGHKLTIGFSNYLAVIPFYRAMIAGVKKQASEYGWNVVVTDSNADPSHQQTDIQSLIARKVDALLVSPGDENALIPAYKAAAAAHIPVVSIANRLSPAGARYQTAYYGIPLERLGQLQAQALVKAMHGKGNVLQVTGPPGIAFVTQTAVGSKEVFGQHPGVKVVFSQATNALAASEGFRVAQDGLSAKPNIQGAWAQDDEVAVGVVRALQLRGLAGKIPVAWNGGTPDTMDMAAKGELVGVILPTYQWGMAVVREIHAAVDDGQPFTESHYGSMFLLRSAAQARSLIAQCPATPDEVWCLGRS